MVESKRDTLEKQQNDIEFLNVFVEYFDMALLRKAAAVGVSGNWTSDAMEWTPITSEAVQTASDVTGVSGNS